MTIKSYVINLKKRPDRLEFFDNKVKKFLPNVNFELVEAIDGTTLDFNDENFTKNINPWNFKYLNEKMLKGVAGCCLSHLSCYKK